MSFASLLTAICCTISNWRYAVPRSVFNREEPPILKLQASRLAFHAVALVLGFGSHAGGISL